jgi:alkylation response protein AidB-like acyl-CoA dehydrogenase
MSTSTVHSQQSAPEANGQDGDALSRVKQMREAEELLFSGPPRTGFAKALYSGEFRGGSLFPYPELSGSAERETRAAVDAVRAFVRSEIDAAAIDREADIPERVVRGLAELGVLGMTAPAKWGGRGFGQQQYCRILEVIGGQCSSTAVFVNAHHSIGIRALLLFGTPAQQEKWLPPLVRGDIIAAFALTEPEAGSDSGNVQTQAVPSEDGRVYRLTGRKRYITNGAMAGVLTVMARTPDPAGGPSKITAFLVTPDMPGFEVVEGRMPKCGIRGTATSTLEFRDMPVPAENILGPIGKGLKVALTVLDFGRTTFGASCTGAAKTCLEAAVAHAKGRRQFGRPLADFQLVRKKIARMAAFIHAMESTTYQTAALIDSGSDDYMLETAILKVFATEALWEIVYETLQIHGGAGYFTDRPYERMMRDARINQIGEGANEVLKAFICLVGMREAGEPLRKGLEDLGRFDTFFPAVGRLIGQRLERWTNWPEIPVTRIELRSEAGEIARRVKRLSRVVERTLMRWSFRHDLLRHPENIVVPQYDQERIAHAVIALVTASCSLARLDAARAKGQVGDLSDAAGLLYLKLARRVFDQSIAELSRNDDMALERTAAAALGT